MSTVWSFDLGKGSIGEAVRELSTNQFLHVESLLIPAEFASTKEATKRRRFMRTRLAHKMREQWLDEVWQKAGQKPLTGRRVGKVDGKWKLISEGDPRLEREFPEKGDSTSYTSCLLRIKLLRGEKLEPWQIYKALHSAVQKRGYERVPWATKDAARQGKTLEEVEKSEEIQLATKDPSYREAVGAWSSFKTKLSKTEFQFPCYYDAHCMGLWSPESGVVSTEPCGSVRSTQRVRFNREDVNNEIISLANQAAKLMPELQAALVSLKSGGWLIEDTVEGKAKDSGSYLGKRVRSLAVLAESVGELLCHGPSGCAYNGYGYEEWNNGERWLIEVLEHPDKTKIGKTQLYLHGGDGDWNAATGQKIPRFDNRIIASCALMPRFGVCKLGPRYSTDENKNRFIDHRSLWAAEVTFLLQLKNQQVFDDAVGGVRYLNQDEMNEWLNIVREKALKTSLADGWERQLLECYKITRPRWREWCVKNGMAPLGLEEAAAETEESEDASKVIADKQSSGSSKSSDIVKAPRPNGRSRFCKATLGLLRHLLLGKDTPDTLLGKLNARDAGLVSELSLHLASDGESGEGKLKKLTEDDFAFIPLVWKSTDGQGQPRDYAPYQLRIPDMALRYLRAKHKLTAASYHDLLNKPSDDEARKETKWRANAIAELIREQRNPIVRERLHRFWQRLVHYQESTNHETEPGLGLQDPECLVLEFIRDDKDTSLDGQKRVKTLQETINRNEKKRETARKALGGSPSNDLIVKWMLLNEQGGTCIYEHTGLGCSDLNALEIEHIVPRALGGPDAYWNWVLCTPDANAEKGDRVPFAWFKDEKSSGEWRDYQRRVLLHKATLGRRKVDLLLSHDAAELVGEKYTSLADTAWVSRLAQSIARLHFGWPLDDQQGTERVITISGGLTARIRRKYMLDSLLGEDKEAQDLRANIDRVLVDLKNLKKQPRSEEVKEKRQELRQELSKLTEDSEKQREDQRHHALDAMLLAFLPGWARDRNKEDFFRFPPETGDTPLYAPEDDEKVECCRRELRNLWDATQPVRNQIKETKDEAARKALKDSILPQRRRMAAVYKALDRLKQPRGIAAVRRWFRERLLTPRPEVPQTRLLPQWRAFNSGGNEETLYRKVYLVRKESVEQSATKCAELPFRPDTASPDGRITDVRWLATRIQSIVPHKSYEDAKAVKTQLKAAFKSWRSLARGSSVTEERMQWLKCMEEAGVPSCFVLVGRGKNKQSPAAADCEVKTCKVEVLPSARYPVIDLAYASGRIEVWNPDHLHKTAGRLLLKLDTPKGKLKRKGKAVHSTLPVVARSEDDPPWDGFLWDRVNTAKLQSQALIDEVGEKLEPLLPGPKPSKNATEDEQDDWKAKKDAFDEALKGFAKQHGLPMSYYVRKEGETRKPRRPNLTLKSLLFEAKDKVFSLVTLRKQTKAVVDNTLADVLDLVRAALSKYQQARDQEQWWKIICGEMRAATSKDIETFRADNTDPTTDDWLTFFKSLEEHKRQRVLKANQTVGMSMDEYCDLSKDGTGLYARGNNQGYIICSKGDDYKAEPIRFFAKLKSLKAKLTEDGWIILDPKPWRTGTLLELKQVAGTAKKPVVPGHYFLGSIQNRKRVNLKACFGEEVPSSVSLKALWKSELRRHQI